MRANLTATAIYAALILSMLLVGCKQQEPEPFTSPLAVPAPADTSPLPTATAVEPEPSPPPTLVFPTSQPGLATVTGVLRIEYTQADVYGFSLYLGEVIQTTDPDQQVVGLDKAVAPLAILDTDTGEFVFYDVPPGWYALEIDRPLLVPVLVNDPEDGGTLYLTIEADDKIDLGTLHAYLP